MNGDAYFFLRFNEITNLAYGVDIYLLSHTKTKIY